jgi:hypothetical protein
VRAGASSDAPAAVDASADAQREPESQRASAPATPDARVAAEGGLPQRERAADAARLDAGPQGFGGEGFRTDGARVVTPERGARSTAPEREARSAAPETGEAATPYAPSAATHAQAATPAALSQAEEDAASEERRGRVARVREGTRARVENTRARVERVKDDALVALEETPDDSGLRFVAVAVVLFVLFIVFLLLSVTVLR